MKLHENKELFADAVESATAKYEISSDLIIKDYFVFLFLKEFHRLEPDLIFKGGTSLSKCHHIINRFSEDIDLSFTKEDGTALSEGQRKRVNRHVKQVCKLLGFEILNEDKIWSDRRYNKLDVDTGYENIFTSVRSHIIVEVVLKVLAFPVSEQQISSFITDFFREVDATQLIEEYDLEHFLLNVQSIERTFIDKVFAVCDYYIDGNIHEKSRHVYDLYMIWPEIKIDDDFKELVQEVREERAKHQMCSSAQEDIDINELLSKILSEETYKDDYKNITQHLLYDDITYNQAIKVIEKIIAAKLF